MSDCIEEFLDISTLEATEGDPASENEFSRLHTLLPPGWENFSPFSLTASPYEPTPSVMANMFDDPFNAVDNPTRLNTTPEKRSFMAHFWTETARKCASATEYLYCISSPQRTLMKQPQSDTTTSVASSSTSSNSQSTELDIFNFICGVNDANLVCQTSINCKAHSVHDKLRVKRSKPLKVLLTYRTKNRQEFNQKYHWVLDKLRQSLPQQKFPPPAQRKALGLLHQFRLNSLNPLTIRQKSPRDSSRASSSSSDGASFSSSQKASELEKGKYIKQLSLESSFRIKEIVAYLHYRLKPYQSQNLQTRITELTCRSKDNRFPTNNNYI